VQAFRKVHDLSASSSGIGRNRKTPSKS
jgi:hypothetical protein